MQWPVSSQVWPGAQSALRWQQRSLGKSSSMMPSQSLSRPSQTSGTPPDPGGNWHSTPLPSALHTKTPSPWQSPPAWQAVPTLGKFSSISPSQSSSRSLHVSGGGLQALHMPSRQTCRPPTQPSAWQAWRSPSVQAPVAGGSVGGAAASAIQSTAASVSGTVPPVPGCVPPLPGVPPMDPGSMV